MEYDGDSGLPCGDTRRRVIVGIHTLYRARCGLRVTHGAMQSALSSQSDVSQTGRRTRAQITKNKHEFSLVPSFSEWCKIKSAQISGKAKRVYMKQPSDIRLTLFQSARGCRLAVSKGCAPHVASVTLAVECLRSMGVGCMLRSLSGSTRCIRIPHSHR